jgi:EAL domain-containing protein (putative c-di-GMP-specific phosphodiesterase class I)
MAEFEGRPETSTPDRIETPMSAPDHGGQTPGAERESGVHLRSAPSASTPPSSKARPERKTRVLLVDDDQLVLRGLGRVLRHHGYEITTATNGRDAAQLIDQHSYDVVLSDIAMPGMDGIQLLREVRARDLSVPVVMITGSPALSSAIQALELGAFHYLTKPIAIDDMERIIDKAAGVHRMALVSQQAAVLLGDNRALGADRAGLEASLGRAIQSFWMAYQPIVRATDRSVFGYEALLRSSEPTLPHPVAVIDAAEQIGRLEDVGRTVRERAASAATAQLERAVLFVNLHVDDLADAELYREDAALSRIAERVVLEISERSALDRVKDTRGRTAKLRELGFRIAVDDLGAGYAGLTNFALLEPEVVKLDMSLVRDSDKSSTKQKIIRSVVALAKDMGILVVAEGVETRGERDALIELGCDLLQGFLFARPGPAFPEARW